MSIFNFFKKETVQKLPVALFDVSTKTATVKHPVKLLTIEFLDGEVRKIRLEPFQKNVSYSYIDLKTGFERVCYDKVFATEYRSDSIINYWVDYFPYIDSKMLEVDNVKYPISSFKSYKIEDTSEEIEFTYESFIVTPKAQI